jgi:hypothetical protein
MLPMQIPSLERQRLLVNLARAAVREKQLMKQLMEIRQQELDLVARKLLA